MNHSRTLLARAACVLILASPAAAQEEQRAFLDVSINTVAKGDTLVVLRPPDALVGISWLTGAGLTDFKGTRETIDGNEFVSLVSLAPAVAFSVDERDLRLAITATPELFGRQVRDLRQARPANLVYRSSTSGFLNYSLTGDSSRNYHVFSEAGLSVRGALLSSTMSVTPRSTVRGLTSLTIDDRTRIRRWTIGDVFASTGPLGGDALIGGVTLTRDFSVEPYFVRYPTLSLSTPVSMPSTVEVHVNGRLVRREQVQPGRLDVLNLPLTTGQNDTRIVVRDPFGGVSEVSTEYYATTTALARGVHDYQYSVGVRRGSLSRASWAYGAPAVLARHRVGVTDALTLGGRLEAASDVVSAGPIANVRLPFGELEAAAAASRDAAGIGSGLSLSYMYAAGFGSGGASARVLDAGYATLTPTSNSQRTHTELRAFAGIPIRRVSVSAQQSYARLHDESRRIRTEVLASTRLGRSAHLTASVARVTDAQPARIEAGVGLTMMFGGRTSATTSIARGPEGLHTGVDLQRPLPIGTGFGYQLRTYDELGLPSGALQYQGEHGRYEIRQDSTGGRHHTSVNVAGALVGIGGRVFATRPVRSSFALVQVPGVKDVRGFWSNQEIGRTDARGNILVPDLLPYYGNVLNIADSDIPIDYVIPNTRETVAPPYRGGALVQFPVQRIQTSEGRLVLLVNGVEVPPTYGELTVTVGDKTIASPLGATGEFYFENLPPGSHAAAVAYADGACRFTLDVPVADGAVAKLGVVRCAAGEKR